jgi:hypothetical protein
MYLSPATKTDLAPLAIALNQFRTLWNSLRNPPLHCEFLGTFDDIRALDFLDYEGHRYPSSDLEGAALVWGNVLAHQIGFKWMLSYRGDLLLNLDLVDRQLTVWPFARVLESRALMPPQFGKYDYILAQVARDCIQLGDLSPQALAFCRHALDAE